MTGFQYGEEKKINESAFETVLIRQDRKEKRLFIIIIILIITILLSNLAWLYAWQSYDYVSEETVIAQDANYGGNANYIGRDGDINNGETNNYYKTKNPPKENR